MNTFFPTIQLFFEPGLSCTIDGGQLRGSIVGLDPVLRFRMTDCAHEEQGRAVQGILPEGPVDSGARIRILGATLAQRTSIALQADPNLSPDSTMQDRTIVHESHTVIGLRLSGMEKMGYIWAKCETPLTTVRGRVWGDVRLASLRDDVPAPFLGLAADIRDLAGELRVVEKESMITPAGLDRFDEFGRPWI